MRFLPTFLLLACLTPLAFAADTVGITSKPFGKMPDGQTVTLYTLTNKNGMSASITDYGATVVGIIVPDRNGKMEDVVLGFNKLSTYLTHPSHFGATLGRYANRIANGEFTLNHITYHLARNSGPNAIQGGIHGFDKFVWKEEAVDSNSPAIRFSRLSPDGEEGYPGNVFISVTFTLTDDNRLRLSYEATTDKLTIICLTNHTYFNLAGEGSGTTLDQVLTIHADSYTPTDTTGIPTGEIKSLDGTPFDFRTPTAIGTRIKETGGKVAGYDLNYVLQKGFFSDWALAAEAYDPGSGRIMSVYTDEPGLQLYTSNYLKNNLVGKSGKTYPQYGAFCLETQHYPDSPNHDSFPSTILRPGQTFKSNTVFAFGVK